VNQRVVRFLVRAALRAAAFRSDGVRRRAAFRAKRESACREATRRGARLSARRTARDRFGDGRRERRRVDAARFFADFPFAGMRTPARLAFDSPIAMACAVDRAPCFPSRT
jgi:hypothetical protein